MAEAPTGESASGSGAAVSPRRSRSLRVLRIVFGLAGLLFLVLAFARTWDASRDVPIPTWIGWAGGGLAILTGLVTAGRSWVALFEGEGDTAALTHAFFASQLGKYIPGGIWQPAGQAGLAAGAGVGLARAVTLMPVHLVTQFVAGASLGGLLGLLAPELPLWLRLVAVAALASVVLLHRRWMAAVAGRIRRWRGSAETADLVPAQRAILRSYAWSVVTMALSGAAFALLLASLPASEPELLAALAFPLAWAIGFAAVPFPSGLGVREAVLIASLASGTALVIAASVAHRLVQMAGEVLMIGITARAAR